MNNKEKQRLEKARMIRRSSSRLATLVRINAPHVVIASEFTTLFSRIEEITGREIIEEMIEKKREEKALLAAGICLECKKGQRLADRGVCEECLRAHRAEMLFAEMPEGVQ